MSHDTVVSYMEFWAALEELDNNKNKNLSATTTTTDKLKLNLVEREEKKNK